MKIYLAVLIGVYILGACATVSGPRVIERLPEAEIKLPPPPPLPTLSYADLVHLSKQGLAPDSIIGRIKESRTRLRLSATDVLTLKTQGVALAVLDHLLDADRLATADDCTAQINQRSEEARIAQQQAIQQAELMGWQRCQLSFLMGPFPGWRPFPNRP